MMECFHPTSTLLDRAKQQNLPRLVDYLMSAPVQEQNGNIFINNDDHEMICETNGNHEDMDTYESAYINESYVTRM